MKKVVEPKAGEDQDTFISRCMSAEASAFPDEEQRFAVCRAKFAKSVDDKQRYRQGKKRKMMKFMITELSAVDSPAQEGARALILKRAEAEKCDEGSTLVLLTSTEDGHSHALWMYSGNRGGETSCGRAPDSEQHHDHPWILDGTGQITIGENDGHTHIVDQQQLFQVVMNAQKQATLVSNTDLWDHYAVKLVTGSTDQEDIMPEPTKDEVVKAAEDRAVAAEAKAERATKVAELTDVQKAHFNTLDEAGQTEYLGKSAEERQALIEKSPDEDPVIYTDGQGNEFRKSDDPRLVSMAKERDADRKELAKSRVEREQDKLEKRAEAELPHLPGELKVRAAIVKAIDGIEDEGTRKAAHESIQAGSKAIKAAFDSVGTSTSPDVTNAEKELDGLAKAYAKEKGISYIDAYSAVAESNPELAKRAIDGN